MKKILLPVFVFFAYCASAQVVPKQMSFGGMQLTLTEGARKQIQSDVDRLTRSPTYYGILTDRINLYFPIIERIFAEQNVPDEIKFLAVQESALISDAVSVANAVGYWQFKDFTAREVGLKVTKELDERLNIVSATYGAAKYLKGNNFFYDNWIYAVMAYNTGRGGAKPYLKEANYGAKKMTIDTKTHWYVRKFLAHIVAFSDAVGKPHTEKLWLDEDRKAKGMTMTQLAKKHRLTREEIEKYNKWLKKGAVPGDKEYTILVPREGVAPVKRQVAKKKEEPKKKIEEIAEKVYPTELKPGLTDVSSVVTIISFNGVSSVLAKTGEDVYSLAKKGRISEAAFRKYNDMSDTDELVADQFYYVRPKKSKSKVGYHVVKSGETLWSISQHYGMKVKKLAMKNRMSIIDEPETGRVLWLSRKRPKNTEVAYHKITAEDKLVAARATDVPEKKDATPAVSPAGEKKPEYTEEDKIVVEEVDRAEELKKVSIHTVAEGETLWGISRVYEVALEDLLRWNGLSDAQKISIGQNVRVKPPVEEVVVSREIKNHTVKGGETLYGISRKYGMTVDEVVELNNLSSTSLDVDQQLKVYYK